MRIEDPAAPIQQTYLRRVVGQLNNLSDGRIAAVNLTASSAPTTGSYAVGDIVRNSAPAEAGSGGSKYVIIGWICTDDSPLTFLEMRTLTGN